MATDSFPGEVRFISVRQNRKSPGGISIKSSLIRERTTPEEMTIAEEIRLDKAMELTYSKDRELDKAMGLMEEARQKRLSKKQLDDLSKKQKQDLTEKVQLKQIESNQKIALAMAKLKAKTKLKIAKAQSKSSASRQAALKRLTPGPMLSREQGMLREMFGGSEPLWGSGQDLPKLNNTLISGGGLVKSGDRGETASFFGF